MKHFFTFFSIIILYPFFANAQSNYKPGYVLKLNGDTTQGYIDFKEWGKNPSKINFKKNISSPDIEKLSAKDITAFAIRGYEYYTRFAGHIGAERLTPNMPGNATASELKIDTVFLRMITKGKNATLYQYTNDELSRYFVAAVNSTPVELVMSMHLNADDLIQPYRLQLLSLANQFQPQSAELQKEIKYAYYARDIKGIVNKLNGSTSDEPFNQAAKNRSAVFFIGLGANVTATGIAGDDLLAMSKKSTSAYPVLSLGTDIYFDKNIKKLILHINADFTATKGSYSYNGSSGTPFVIDYKFTQYMMGLNPEILLNIVNNSSFKFYAAAGGAVNYGIYTGVDHNITYNLTNGTSKSALDPVALSNVFFNGTAKIGIVLNERLDLHFTYVPSYSFTNYANYAINATSYRVGVGYFLK